MSRVGDGRLGPVSCPGEQMVVLGGVGVRVWYWREHGGESGRPWQDWTGTVSLLMLTGRGSERS